MSRHDGLSDWTEELSNRMPHLAKPQVVVLAMWSYGIALTRTCGRRTVSVFLALLLEQRVGTIEQRLREWCYDAQDKQGQKRRALDVSTCFVPLLRWIVALWNSMAIALAVDATSLGGRFVVLTVCVVYRGTGIPVDWTILAGQQKEAWRGHWLQMLRRLRPAIPRDWTVLVLADRGLYASWLFRRIVRLGWHPFLRINQGAKFRPEGLPHWPWLRQLVGQEGIRWRGAGTAFASYQRQLTCTLVACAHGVSRASNAPSAGVGSGNRRACLIRPVRPACGWRCPWPACGWSVWAVNWNSLRPPIRRACRTCAPSCTPPPQPAAHAVHASSVWDGCGCWSS